jgi:pimeloyl-ACP methyl ester carboxylesterase
VWLSISARRGRFGFDARAGLDLRTCADLAAFLDDAGAGAVVPIGCAVGVMIAAAFAGLYPARCAGAGTVQSRVPHVAVGARHAGEPC